jgi:8-oxo-dGTP pyrophosphatase MutT (NUDIX family)
MLTEKSIGIVLIKREADVRFLILYKKANANFKEAWEFPKGIVDKGEAEMQTGIRELTEETGLTTKDFSFLPEFHDKISFFFRNQNQELVKKEVSFLLAQTNKSDIMLSSEHDAYRWAPYLEAFELLSQKNLKEILRKANDYVKKKFAHKFSF